MHHSALVPYVALMVALVVPAAPPSTRPAELNVDQKLILAAFQGDVAGVAAAMNAGAYVDARFGPEARNFLKVDGSTYIGSERWTALLAVAHAGAISEDKRVEVAKFLIDAHAELNFNDGYGTTALHEAVGRKHEPLALLLLAQPAIEVNSRDDIYIDGTFNTTPLHRAAGQPRVMKALLEKGARIYVHDSEGGSPLDWAVRHRDEAGVKLLLDAGAPVGNERRAFGWSGDDKEAAEHINTMLDEAAERQAKQRRALR